VSKRAGRGSLSGRWRLRDDGSPNLRGGITIERDLPAGSKLWLSGWTRSTGGPDGSEFVSIEASMADGGPRRSRPRRATHDDEPEGRFRDRQSDDL
jgi:hypothetical protein